ncbi:hypothetical protein [Klebsiella pneumoniae]|uniref:hypothetical protein n=1 Tax=Klebsiella pneumoniae TaxID=573 RepID=UPI000E2A99EC|nr:hypothetical protein [Klebsiella pneumoniae]UNS79264.1 hypothetical protein MOQ79_19410 [Klebsiella pneumoniae]SYT75789.1 Uncharacterised protein [Klebsiella pneumoniae]HBR5186969.1 hypothetical protein [Klebsiella pneumoniae]
MTSKLTKEWLQHQISAIEAVGITDSNTLAAFKLALAAMDSEPVAEVYQAPNIGICAALGPSIRMLCPLEPGTKLYRHAQPVPVVPNEIKHRIGGLDWGWEGEFNRGWNACRAAMLERQLVDRVDEKSLTSINPAPDLVSLQKKAESIIGNYPGIPDGYVMVPVEPNGDMLAAAQDAYGETDGDIASTLRAAMLSGGKP